MAKHQEIPVGTPFGRLTVSGPVEVEECTRRNGHRMSRYFYPCNCACGSTARVRSDRLKSGHTQSCGCLEAENLAAHAIKPGESFNLTHGLSHLRLFNVWRAMLDRCYNEDHKGYEAYGGRGIRVCDEWQDFVEFMAWALGNGYDDDLSIDRIDGTKGYCPANCRWVDALVQGRNKLNAVWVEAFGESKRVFDWVEDERCCVNYSVLYGRVFTMGWEGERALTTPVA